MILPKIRFRFRPAAPPAVSGEAPPRPRNGEGPFYLTRPDGLIRVDEHGVSLVPNDQVICWPRGQHPYPEVPEAGWWSQAQTQVDGPRLPIVRPYIRLYPTSVETEDWPDWLVA